MEKIKKNLFYFILILLPFNLRYIFNFETINSIEGFREHLSHSLYAFEIVFLLLLFCCISSFLHQIFIVKNLDYKKILHRLFKSPLFYFSLALIIPSFFAINKNVSLYNSLKILEVIIFFLIAGNLFKKEKVFETSAMIIFLSGIFQSILAIIQIIIQKSIGLKILGESVIAPNILGVAKIDLFDEKFICAYGTFPHPNLLGAFLLLSLLCGLWLTQKHKAVIPSTRDPLGKKYANCGDGIFFVATSCKLPAASCFLILLAIFFTFSRTVWLATFLIIVIYFFQNQKIYIKNIWEKIAGKEKKFLLGCFFVLLASLLILGIFYFKKLQTQESYTLRKTYNSIAIKIIKLKPAVGVGTGNFSNVLSALKNNNDKTLPPWHIQPVHNIYLLIASENGLPALGLFILFLFFLFLKNKKSNKYFIAFFLSFLFFGFFDHYFWTLPQGQFIFWLGLTFFVTDKNNLPKNKSTF